MSSSSPSLRALHLSPGAASPITSRQSPSGSGRAVKQLALAGLPLENNSGGSNNKPGSPLAVPLEAPQLRLPSAVSDTGPTAVASTAQQPTQQPAQLLLMTSAEVEFRKPLLPPPAAAAALRQQQGAAMAAAFREQVGQYLPKFTNRRGRQTRSRAKNMVVSRQLLQQQPRQLLLKQQQPPPQQLHVNSGIHQLFPHQQFTIVETSGATPVTIFTTSAVTSGGLEQLPAATAPPQQQHQQLQFDAHLLQTQTEQPHQQHHTLFLSAPPSAAAGPMLGSAASLSPPQISIPSPALSPIRCRDETPSPTPSLSALMDLSFSDAMVGGGGGGHSSVGLLSTPTKNGGGGNLTFLSDLLVEDSNSLLHTPPRPSTPLRPPSRYLAEPGGTELSLSSWALSFDSPLKGGGPGGTSGGGGGGGTLLHSEDSQASIISTSSEVWTHS
jgi:hypothetical protein